MSPATAGSGSSPSPFRSEVVRSKLPAVSVAEDVVVGLDAFHVVDELLVLLHLRVPATQPVQVSQVQPLRDEPLRVRVRQRVRGPDLGWTLETWTG